MGEKDDTIKMIGDKLKEINTDGEARCRICNALIVGENFAEVLQLLGEHGERMHPGEGGEGC